MSIWQAIGTTATLGLAVLVGCNQGTYGLQLNEQHDAIEHLQSDLKGAQKREQELAASVTTLQTEVASLKTRLDEQAKQAAEANAQINAKLDAKFDALNKKVESLPVETKLQMRLDLDVQEPFDEAVALLSAKSRIPIRIEAVDFAEQKIPKIRVVALKGPRRTAQDLLCDALRQGNDYAVHSLADPRLEIVYVVDRRAGQGKETLVITTRKRAAQRGELPKAFAVAR
jgi:hypothetical protein